MQQDQVKIRSRMSPALWVGGDGGREGKGMLEITVSEDAQKNERSTVLWKE